jgi:hypothetical protein
MKKVAVNVITMIDSVVFSSYTIVGDVRVSKHPDLGDICNEEIDMERIGAEAEKLFVERIEAEVKNCSIKPTQEDIEIAKEDGYIYLNQANCEIIINWAEELKEV